MDYRVRLGILAGLAAAAAYLVLNLIAVALRLTAINHMLLAARLVLPSTAAALSSGGRLAGLIGHFVLGAGFGILLAFLLRPIPRRYYFLLGLVYGIALYFVDMGLLVPALRLGRPIWDYGYFTMATDLVLHLVYGGVLGALIAANVETDLPG